MRVSLLLRLDPSGRNADADAGCPANRSCLRAMAARDDPDTLALAGTGADQARAGRPCRLAGTDDGAGKPIGRKADAARYWSQAPWLARLHRFCFLTLGVLAGRMGRCGRRAGTCQPCGGRFVRETWLGPKVRGCRRLLSGARGHRAVCRGTFWSGRWNGLTALALLLALAPWPVISPACCTRAAGSRPDPARSARAGKEMFAVTLSESQHRAGRLCDRQPAGFLPQALAMFCLDVLAALCCAPSRIETNAEFNYALRYARNYGRTKR